MTAKPSSEDHAVEVDADTLTHITHRLTLTPAQRLRYLCDALAFEDRARTARRVT